MRLLLQLLSNTFLKKQQQNNVGNALVHRNKIIKSRGKIECRNNISWDLLTPAFQCRWLLCSENLQHCLERVWKRAVSIVRVRKCQAPSWALYWAWAWLTTPSTTPAPTSSNCKHLILNFKRDVFIVCVFVISSWISLCCVHFIWLSRFATRSFRLIIKQTNIIVYTYLRTCI